MVMRLLEEAGKKKGVDYDVHWYEGEGHGFRTPEAVKKSKLLTGEFFDNRLH